MYTEHYNNYSTDIIIISFEIQRIISFNRFIPSEIKFRRHLYNDNECTLRPIEMLCFLVLYIIAKHIVVNAI